MAGDTLDPIFRGKQIAWGIKNGIFTISGEILSISKTPQSEKFVGKDNIGNRNRRVWHGRYRRYHVEAVIAKELDESTLPDEGDIVTIDALQCFCDTGAVINWVQDGETKVTMDLDYEPFVSTTGA